MSKSRYNHMVRDVDTATRAIAALLAAAAVLLARAGARAFARTTSPK